MGRGMLDKPSARKCPGGPSWLVGAKYLKKFNDAKCVTRSIVRVRDGPNAAGFHKTDWRRKITGLRTPFPPGVGGGGIGRTARSL